MTFIESDMLPTERTGPSNAGISAISEDKIVAVQHVGR